MAKLHDYEPIVGSEIIEELKLLAGKISGISVQNINSTKLGGGVAEILLRLIPMLHELGINADWDVIKGGEKFFTVTKKMHNALHGQNEEFTDEEFDLFIQTNEENAQSMSLHGDVMIIHDPQPIALVLKKNIAKNKWIWRCHIDFSNPNLAVWNFLKEYIERYDASVFSAPAFARNLSIPQALIPPSIDPLSDKNRNLSEKEIDAVLARFNINRERPMVTQISRFDYLKDPVGVIEVFRKVRKYVDCQLVLAGGGASDDPEGAKVLAQVREASKNDPDILILLLPPASDIEINALQRASTVILQKSLREGFGLTVTEALWKRKPVIAGAVGGIPLQITHKFSGLLSLTIDGTAFALKQLLQNPAYAKVLGENGHKHVKRNFLITRQLRDYLLLILSLYHPKENPVYV